jgi:hypothetical protein
MQAAMIRETNGTGVSEFFGAMIGVTRQAMQAMTESHATIRTAPLNAAMISGRNVTGVVSGVFGTTISVTRQAMQAMTGSHATIPAAPLLVDAQTASNIGNVSTGDVYDDIFEVMCRFNQASPPSFQGNYNPNGAERWMQEVENVLRGISCPEDHKVYMAAFMLTGEAEQWWGNVRERLERRGVEITWGLFRYEFLVKYYP